MKKLALGLAAAVLSSAAVAAPITYDFDGNGLIQFHDTYSQTQSGVTLDATATSADGSAQVVRTLTGLGVRSGAFDDYGLDDYWVGGDDKLSFGFSQDVVLESITFKLFENVGEQVDLTLSAGDLLASITYGNTSNVPGTISTHREFSLNSETILNAFALQAVGQPTSVRIASITVNDELPAVVAVPEPTSIALFGLGLVGLWGSRRIKS